MPSVVRWLIRLIKIRMILNSCGNTRRINLGYQLKAEESINIGLDVDAIIWKMLPTSLINSNQLKFYFNIYKHLKSNRIYIKKKTIQYRWYYEDGGRPIQYRRSDDVIIFFFFFFFNFSILNTKIGKAWCKTSTAQIWWKSDRGSSKYGCMNN